jgi:hypothetical protein
MAFTCYVGWWYQRLIQNRFILTIEDIYRCENDENNSDMEMDNMGPSDDHSADAPLTVMEDGAQLEELYPAESPFDASAPVKVMAPTSVASTIHITKRPIGEGPTKIETLDSE